MIQPAIESRQQKLELDIRPIPLEVEGDPQRLAQVFGNLLNNASKYTPPGGSITLSAALQNWSVSALA